MKITALAARQLLSALVGMDGYEKPISVDGTNVIVKTPYKLGAKTRMSIARNIHRLQETSNAITEAGRGFMAELSGGGGKLPPEKVDEFNAEMARMLSEVHDIDLILLSESDLWLDDNPLPPSMITALMPIVVE